MAFKDSLQVLYDGSIRLEYKDKIHRYYVKPRIDFGRDESDPKAWGKVLYPSGVTTVISNTLEKDGLKTWTVAVCLKELFGYYEFEDEKGEKKKGFRKDGGTILGETHLNKLHRDELLALVESASSAWVREQKKGADIGSVTHNAIEQYFLGNEFSIKDNYLADIDTKDKEAVDKAMAEIDMANLAYGAFTTWWADTSEVKEVVGVEQILYSKELNMAGTYDGLLKIDGRLLVCDWKTTKASVRAGAPQGIYYTYFCQLAFYEIMRREMGFEPADDLMALSFRKDGKFNVLKASDLGLTVEDCIEYAIAVYTAYEYMKEIKSNLIRLGREEK